MGQHTDSDDRRIPVGISACLLGRRVRHDGGHKHSRYCTGVLADYFRFRSLCPEMGAGLSTPRPAMHLVDSDRGVRLRATRGERDFTDLMNGFVTGALDGLADLRGFVLMAKSPSCGMERIRVYREDGEVARRDASGLFAAALTQRYPLMPVEEEGRLNDDRLRENFVERVFVYDDWCRLIDGEGGLTAKGLIDFHRRHKFQLLAHCQATYRRLGPLLADLKSRPLRDIADHYIRAFMPAMAKRISPGAHVNAMLHLMGFLRDDLGEQDRGLIHQQIEAYGRGEVPLVVPMTLLRGAQSKVGQPYLAGQQYLRPYPDALGLRNRV